MPRMMNVSAGNSSSFTVKMPDILSTFPTLDETANNTNTTNSTLSIIPGGLSGYVHASDLIIIGVASAVIMGVLIGCWRWTHRRYAKKRDKEVEQAGNIQINMSRPNLKK